MANKQILNLFISLGIRPYFKGIPTTAYLIELVIDSLDDLPHPSMKKLYTITAEHYGIKPEQVCDNLKTIVDTFCNLEASKERFLAIVGYPIDGKLSNKEFVYAIARYLAAHPE